MASSQDDGTPRPTDSVAQNGAPGSPHVPPSSGITHDLGNLADGDIMALAFIVMMEASKSAREDLKAIMDGVKLTNKQKKDFRRAKRAINQVAAGVKDTHCPHYSLTEADKLALMTAVEDCALAMMTVLKDSVTAHGHPS